MCGCSPGGTCTLIGTYVVTAADRDGGQIDNTGLPTGIRRRPVTDDETVVVPTPTLSVDKPAPTNADEDGSGDVSVGDTLTYTVTATNTRRGESDECRGGRRLITPTGGSTPCALSRRGYVHAGRYLCGDGGGRDGGSDRQHGTADSDQTPAMTDDETTPVPTPSLSVDKPAPTNADEDGSGDVSVGDTLTYTVTATNTGTANLTNVVVTDA